MATHPLALACASVTLMLVVPHRQPAPIPPAPRLAYRLPPIRAERWSPTTKHRRAERDLAAMLFGECRGDGIACMTAVANVAMNRARAGLDARYGRGLDGVLGKRKAFSCMRRVDPNWPVIASALAGRLALHSPDGIAWTMALGQAHIAMHRGEPDPTRGATYYHTLGVRPAWTRDTGMVRVARIGAHVFYRKV